MDFKLANRITAAIVLVFSAVIYVMTVQPTLSFWDCGEFIACAYTLGVPHPPGAPFFILVGKIFTLLPMASDIGLRMNYLSVFSSAACVFLVYFVTVKIIMNWRGFPQTTSDVLLICGSAMVGALAYAFSESFWFNALEAEVYGFGTFLIGLCFYLMMLWWEKADEPGSDKYLLMMAFVVGLSIGIHLIVVQCIAIAGILFYFRRYDYTPKGLLIAFVVSSIAFFIVYPGIVKKFPAMIEFSAPLAITLVLTIILGIYYSVKTKNSVLNIACMSIFLIILGYSTYAGVLIRANVDNLPINENTPNNMERLLSYLNREQYGDQPLFLPRRYSQEPQHRPTWQNYSSDWDFLMRYQIGEMFNRYFLWQFVGREGHHQGADWDPSKLLALPFLVGLFGMFYHFRRDWKLAFVLLFAFLILGIVTALYQNQQNPQPRERDYFYVGAYLIFCIWIAIGVAGVIEFIKKAMRDSLSLVPIVSVVLIICVVIVPLNMLRANYPYLNRHDNYFPYDYAYNILQSVEKDAILITNGDNDTFPLWCLQAVYGIRQDVRIVNLSLAQTDWYNLQLKNSRPYGALPVPMTFTDEQLRKLAPSEWDENKVFSIDIPKSAYPDSMQSKPDLPNKINFRIPATIRQQYQGRMITAVKANDLLLLDIIRANKWQRPIYFSVTVTEDNFIGLGDYLVLGGMAQRLVPYKAADASGIAMDVTVMRESLLQPVNVPSSTPHYGFMYRGLDNKDIFFDENHERNIQTYRTLYLRLAEMYALDSATYPLAVETLDKMMEYIPPDAVTMDYRIKYHAATLYMKLGEKAKFDALSADIESSALNAIENNPGEVQSYYNPYRILMDMYETKGEYGKAIEILQRLQSISPNDHTIKAKIDELRQKMSGAK